MSAGPHNAAPKTVILGGGIAGLEALLALRDLAPGRTEVTLIAPNSRFTYKPLIVEEPFTFQPAEHRELEPTVREVGGRFVLGVVDAVHPESQTIVVSDDERRYVHELPYDLLIVCVGGRSRAVYKHAATFRFRSVGDPLEVDDLIAQAEAHDSRRVGFVVPPGVGWTLPLYELALLTRVRAEETGRPGLRIALYTPEESPLILFGETASESVAQVLEAREIDFFGGVSVRESDGALRGAPGGEVIDAGAVAALPAIEGPRLSGLPFDEHGFIPIDEHSRVIGVEDVYAAGDGANFPIKQGGLGTQQADAAAEHIAARLGADVEARPFRPVLRGKLLTGGESVGMRHDLAGGHGEGIASAHHLWWPPDKVGGRYLAPWLAREQRSAEHEAPPQLVDIEVALPREWQGKIGFDPYNARP
ncbi:MAG: FAD-dependent oxidoreductase [Thermoleophilaceae bacterium]